MVPTPSLRTLPPFNALCEYLTVHPVNIPERIGCSVRDFYTWSWGSAAPTDDQLVAFHFAVTDSQDISATLKELWADILRMPVGQAMHLPRLIQIEGTADQSDPRVTVGEIIEHALSNRTGTFLELLPTQRRIELLRRFAEHAETLSHYCKKG